MRKSMFGLAWCCFSAALALTAPHAATAQSLDEATAVRLTLERLDEDGPLADRVSAAEEDAAAAGAWTNPEIAIEREGADGLGGAGYEESLRVTQTFDVFGHRRLAGASGRRLADAARFDRLASRREAAAAARILFYELVALDMLSAASDEWARVLASAGQDAERRQREGDVSRYDRLRIDTERAAPVAQAAEIEAQRRANWSRLAALMGAPAYSGVSGELLPPTAPSPERAAELVLAAPELASISRRAEAEDFSARSAARAALPEPTFGVGVRRVDDNLSDDTGVILTVEAPIPVLNGGGARRRAAEARASAMRAERTRETDRLRGEATALAAEASTLRAVAAEYSETAVRRARELRNVASSAYRGGEIGVLEFLDAGRSAYEAEARSIELALDARRAHVRLNQLIEPAPGE